MTDMRDDLAGQYVERWILEQRVQEHGLVDLYAVRSRDDGERATLAMLPAGRTDLVAFRARFTRECWALAKTETPHLPRHLGCGTAFGRLWSVTAGAPAPSLAQRMRAGWRPEGGQILACAVQIARGLEAAAAIGVTHRALHPALILLDDEGRVQITGFGIAPDPAGDEATHLVHEVTQPPECLAPEQISAAPFDVRGDLYASACLLYWLACGRPPFIGARAEILSQHLDGDVVPPRRFSADCPPELSAFLVGLLAKRPADRVPSTPTAMLAELDAMRQGRAIGYSTRRVLRYQAASQTTGRPGPALEPRAAAPAPRRARLTPAIITASALILGGGIALSMWPAAPAQPVPSPVSPAPAPAPVSVPVPPPAPVVATVARDEPAVRPPEPVQPPAVDPARVRALVARGEHLGPLVDLRHALGEPDLFEAGGSHLWYGDVEFVVEGGYVINAVEHRPGGRKGATR